MCDSILRSDMRGSLVGIFFLASARWGLKPPMDESTLIAASHFCVNNSGGSRLPATSTLQGFFSRPVRWNCRPHVAVYRTGFTVYRLKPVKFKIKFKIACSTGSDQLTDRFDRLPVFQIQNCMFNRFRLAYRPVYRSGLTGYRCFNKKIRLFWSGP